MGVVSDEVVNALLQVMADDLWFLSFFAAEALGELGVASDEVVDALLQSMTGNDWWIDPRVAQALGKLGKQSNTVLPAVVTWIEEHQDSEYQGSGIDALWDLVQ